MGIGTELGRALSAKRAVGALACVMASAGCYASHGLGSEAGELCESPREGVGTPCGAIIATFPEGVCRLADGTTIAFGDLDRDASCEANEDDPEGRLLFVPHHCTAEVPRGRVIASCGPTSDTPTFRVLERPPGSSRTYDLSEASCALTQPMDGEPAGPWMPFGAPRALCSDPYAWCGSPMVLEVIHEERDACGGGAFRHRCTAHFDSERIVVRAETAPEPPGPCRRIIVDRVARCIVPPLPAGRYEVVDETARVLGSVNVPGVRPTGDLEPTCVPL